MINRWSPQYSHILWNSTLQSLAAEISLSHPLAKGTQYSESSTYASSQTVAMWQSSKIRIRHQHFALDTESNVPSAACANPQSQQMNPCFAETSQLFLRRGIHPARELNQLGIQQECDYLPKHNIKRRRSGSGSHGATEKKRSPDEQMNTGNSTALH